MEIRKDLPAIFEEFSEARRNEFGFGKTDKCPYFYFSYRDGLTCIA